MPNFQFTVNVSTEKQSGKFVGKDSLQEEVQSWIENCNEGEISVDDSVYEVTDFEVHAS